MGLVEPAVRVDRDPPGVADDVDDRLDSCEVFGQRRAADLHLDRVVAQIEVAAHLVAQCVEVSAGVVGIVIAAGGIHRDRGGRLAAEVAGDRRVGRFVVEFGVQIPASQFQGCGRGGPIPVTAGLFVAQGACQHGARVDPSGVVQQCIRGRREDARDHPVAQDPALSEPPDRVERDPDARFSVPDADQRDQGDGVVGEADHRVSRGACQSDRPLPDPGDPGDSREPCHPDV